MSTLHPGVLAGDQFPGLQRIEAELVRLRQLRDRPDIQDCLRSELGRIIHALSNAVAMRPAAPLHHPASGTGPSGKARRPAPRPPA